MNNPNMPLPWICLEAFNELQEAEKNLALADEMGFTDRHDVRAVEAARARYEALKDPS
jgi:hypothetical protein